MVFVMSITFPNATKRYLGIHQKDVNRFAFRQNKYILRASGILEVIRMENEGNGT